MLCVLILYTSDGTCSLKLTPKDRFFFLFEKLFMACFYFTLTVFVEICWEEIAEEILFVFCFDNKPTHYLLDSGDVVTSPSRNIYNWSDRYYIIVVCVFCLHLFLSCCWYIIVYLFFWFCLLFLSIFVTILRRFCIYVMKTIKFQFVLSFFSATLLWKTYAIYCINIHPKYPYILEQNLNHSLNR